MKSKINQVIGDIYRKVKGIPRNQWHTPPNMGRYLRDRLGLRLLGGGDKRTIRGHGVIVTVA